MAEPGYFAKFFAFLVKLVPDVGPLKPVVLKPLPPDAQERYRAALEHAVTRYQTTVAAVMTKRVDLPAQNLDTATPTTYRHYAPADEAYGELAAKLAKGEQSRVPEALRTDVQRFYATRSSHPKKDDDDRELDAALARLAARP